VNSASDYWFQPLSDLWIELSPLIPKLSGAVLIILAGLALGLLLRAMARGLFHLLRLDAKLKDVWIFKVFSQTLHGEAPSQALANFALYAVLFLAVLLGVRVLGPGLGRSVSDALLGVMPRVLSFTMILFLGSMLAMGLSVLAQVVLVSSGSQHPHFWGKVIAWGTFGLAVIFSIEQLGLAGQLLTWLLLGGLAALALASALAFGLGCKDLAREFLIEWMRSNKEVEQGEGGAE
jgi:hypothetical protein